MEISGKKAVVVGGASGFGRATVEALATRGASVAILDRPQSKGKEIAEQVGGSFYEVDVTDFDGTEQTLATVVEDLGGLHIAVTTAGGGIGERTVKKDGPHSLESFRQSIDLNLIGTFNISRLSAWHMSKKRARRRGGRRARRHHQHRLHRRIRGPDRPDRLYRLQGRDRRHVPDDGA